MVIVVVGMEVVAVAYHTQADRTVAGRVRVGDWLGVDTAVAAA